MKDMESKSLPKQIKRYAQVGGVVGKLATKLATQKYLGVKIDKKKSLFNYEKKVLIKELILNLKLGYFEFEKEKSQKVKFNLEVNYQDKQPSNDKDIKSIVNYAKIVRLIKKLVKNKHYNFLETLAEDVFDEIFKDKRIDKISLQIEKLEIMKDCSSVGIQISKKRSNDQL